MKKLAALLTAVMMMLAFIPTAAFAQVDEAELQAYLEKVKTERGLDSLTLDEFNTYLIDVSWIEDGIDGFEDVEEMESYLGEVIKADLSNLEQLNEDFEADVVEVLEENDDSIDNYIYVDDAAFAASEYLGYEEGEDAMEFDEEFFEAMAAELDLTREEIERLTAHMESLDEELSKPENEEKLNAIAEQMMAFEDFESAKDLTDEQITELLTLTKELAVMLKIDAKFFLVGKDGTEQEISYRDLILMDEEEVQSLALIIELYNRETGEFLADIKLTPEDIGSDIIKDTGNNIKDAVKPAKKPAAPKTVKGAKLPKTASNDMGWALAGLGVMAAGVVMYRRVRSA
ncbi:processed acidic surface protein [Fictibacillus iocasae]|uniref:Processed acidic surface protein n=1 Tax=Fictibacillus iocasae TaxID=2715437 RepID=A0ABW2NUZ3_9BACL